MLVKVSTDHGHVYNSLEENKIKGNLIILNDEEEDEISSAASEMSVANEIKRVKPRFKVSLTSPPRVVTSLPPQMVSSPRTFKWPRDCRRLEEIQRRREGATVISPAMTETLQHLGIYRARTETGATGDSLQGTESPSPSTLYELMSV